jgi:hypothetical protein
VNQPSDDHWHVIEQQPAARAVERIDGSDLLCSGMLAASDATLRS